MNEVNKTNCDMKVWSSQLCLRFKQSKLSLKNVFGASTGFEPMASPLALQCSNNWAMKTHTLGAGQFVEFIIFMFHSLSFHFTPFTVTMNSTNWPAPNVWLKSQTQLRWSHLHVTVRFVYLIHLILLLEFQRSSFKKNILFTISSAVPNNRIEGTEWFGNTDSV